MEHTNNIYYIIKKYLENIREGTRIKYTIPREQIWKDTEDEYNWDIVEEIQMMTRGNIDCNTFVTLRFNDEMKTLLVDIIKVNN